MDSVTAPFLVPVEQLRAIVASVFRAAGSDEDEARIVADSLVASDLRGVHSHGAIRVTEYINAIRGGLIVPGARPKVVSDQRTIVALDGLRAFGQVAAHELGRVAVERASANGIALVTLANVAHVGRVAEWVELVAEGGCIALAWCNGGPSGGNVVPFGGRSARLGTNPMAYALPAARRPAVVADFSTSIVAEGKVRLYLHAGKPVPDEWIVDADGEPTNDPSALYRGGAILPMGGHKGFALALLVEILGGIVADAGCASLSDSRGNGLVLIAIDPARTAAGPDFGTRVLAVLDSVASSPAVSDGQGVVIPGEPEMASKTYRERIGIAFAPETWATIVAAGESVGLDLRSEVGVAG